MLNDFSQIINIIAILILIIVIVFFAVVSVILNYHWSRYGISVDKIKQIKRIYFGVSTVFITIMIVAFIIFLYDYSF